MPRSAWFVLAFASLLTLVTPSMTSPPLAQEPDAVKAPVKDQVGYLLGYSIGRQYAQSGFRAGDFEKDSLMAGLMDAIQEFEPALTEEQLAEANGRIQAMLQKRQSEMETEMNQAALMNKEKSELFMQQNAKAAGIQTLERGLQYQVITEGAGASPTADDTVVAHYTGKLIDGTVFDSSVERGEPITIQVGQVIPGWQMALPKMKLGSKWRLFIPSELGYGERGSAPKIGPNEALVFDIELLEIK